MEKEVYMLVRGIRGAITVNNNTKEEIIKFTKELLITLQKENDFKIEDIVSVFFSVTPDLNAPDFDTCKPILNIYPLKLL